MNDVKRKYSIGDMRKLAEKRGGECLSKEYINSNTKLKWRCAEGHEWESVPSSIIQGHWCPECSGHNYHYSIKDMKDIAQKRGGECLSESYIDNKTKLRWRCKEGHEWEASPSNIRRGSWCPKCGDKRTGDLLRKLTIEDMKKLASDKGGECLSNKYYNPYRNLRWRCKEGHEWEASPSNIRRGTWCPVCGRIQSDINRRKYSIENMKEIALKRGGECLSNEYKNSHSKLKWRCKEGHIWKANPSHILMGTWCPVCANIIPLTIDDMKELAKIKGGECISNEYINARRKLVWKCSEGHIWKAYPYSIKSGTWCPVCSKGISERICRKIFEEIFQKHFPTKKPKWLRNHKTGGRLELDGYCEDLKLAFEYQGEQHYTEKKNFFHRNQKFEDQIQRDKIKKEKCKKNGVTLIEIPYNVPFDNFSNYIIQNCLDKGINIPSVSLKIFDIHTLDGIYNSGKLNEMHEIAQSKRGECLSEYYIDDKTKLIWKCKKGHIWKSAPGSVKHGTWCPYCSHNIKLTMALALNSHRPDFSRN